MSTKPDTEASAIAALAKQATARIDTVEGVPVILNPETGKVEVLSHLLPKPKRHKASPRFTTIGAFIDYVTRFKIATSTIYAPDCVITAVIDHKGEPTTGTSWEEHTASVALEHSESLVKWVSKQGSSFSQEMFADFLEERSLEIVSPDAASLLELTRDLQVTHSSVVKSVVRDGGNHKVSLAREQSVKSGPSEIEIPAWFEVRFAPFKNQKARIDVRARLRVTVKNEHVVFIYELQQLDECVEEVLSQILDDVAAKTKLPLYR